MTDIDDEPAVINIADDNELPIDDNEQAQVIPEVVLLDDELPAAEQNSDGEDVEDIGNEAEGKSNEENEAERETNPDDEDNPFADDVDSDEEGGGVQVTIRKIETTDKPMVRQGKLDLDTTAMINQKPIYDLDLAQMEDRPWRKPGADITDYFNYGFTEETWNMYCERQKKLRIEFSGNQKAANEALLSTIKMSNPLANPIINNSSSVVKVLTDNGGRFKPSHNNSNYTQHNHSSVANEQVIRTVISGTTSSTVNTAMPPNPLMDFTRPPPGMNMPPIGAPPALPPSAADAPPGVEADRPPGVEPAPGTAPAPGIGGVGVPGASSVVKVLTDNGGRFKPSHNNSNYTQHNHSSVANEQVIRTVISGTTSSTVNTAMPPNPLMDFTRPPPGMNMPPIGAPPALPPSAAE
uniref:FIP1-like 1 protein n=1 Tax=Caenorhabditis japonica TaxID=281687 RepID=A0A8R1IIB5_CAEJA